MAVIIRWEILPMTERLDIVEMFQNWHFTEAMIESINWKTLSAYDIILLAERAKDWHIYQAMGKNIDFEIFTPKELNNIAHLAGDKFLWSKILATRSWGNLSFEDWMKL